MNQIWLNAVRASAGAAVAPWWRAGGAPEPVAVYQPIGAASLAASYVNLANPGVFDAAPGVAPTWASGTGWGFNGTTQYLDTGYTQATTVNRAVIIRFTNATTANNGAVVGNLNSGGTAGYGISPHRTGAGGEARIYSGNSFATAVVVDGIVAVAATRGYVNGVDVGGMSYADFTPASNILVGAWRTGTNFLYRACDVQAIAIYDTSTDHAIWVPAVSAAMAAL